MTFSIAYVILPFSDIAPADAIRAALARFQRGRRGEVPDEWLGFDDETEALRGLHEALFTFTDSGNSLQIEGYEAGLSRLAMAEVREEMRRRGSRRWQVRFADTMDLDGFVERFCKPLERDPATGAYGRWLNLLGQWDWWDLGGGFDGYIIGEPDRGIGRGVARLSSGENPGRTILSNLENTLRVALDQQPEATVDIRSDRNIELAATLLADARAGRAHACPGALVLPPGSVEEPLRWIDSWPGIGPVQALAWLGLAPDAEWPEVVEAAYTRFQDHWVAGIAYHY